MLRPRLLLARVSTRIRSLLPWVLAMVGLLLAGAVAIARVVGWGPDGAGSWSLVDFRTAVYFPVVCFVTGCNPYDATEFVSRFPVKPFGLYSPLTLVLHLPFALLPLHVAEWLYVGAALLLTVVAAGLALRFATRVVPPRQALIAAALLLLSRPGHSNVVLGQSAATAAVACFAALIFMRSRPLLAGLAFAVATFKPTFGIPLGLVLVAAGEWVAVAVGAVVAGVVTMPVVVVFAMRAGGVSGFARLLVADHGSFATTQEFDPATSFTRLDVTALIGHVCGCDPGPLLALGASLAVLACGLLAVRRLSLSTGSDARPLLASIACLTVLLAVYHQTYDALLLALPLACLGPGRMLARHPLARGVVSALLLLPFCNLVGTYRIIRGFSLSPGTVAIATGVNAAALSAAFVVLLTLALYQRQRSPSCAVA